jgi:DNA invertase Pin-like site-specific DNA recombinase
MINDARKGQFQFIIVYKLDRFTRNRYDSAIYKQKLKQYGVKVISATESISDNPEGVILEAILEASAEFYSLELSQKIRRGYRESALKGNFLGGNIPLGYKREKKTLVIDPETAPIVKWIFEEYAKGVSNKDIIDGLNAKGLRTKNGCPFNRKSFQTLYRNQHYIGVLKYKDILIEDAFPALIDRKTFDKVQTRLDLNRCKGATKKAKMQYLLFNILYCGLCGNSMTGICGTSKQGTKHYYYTCAKRQKDKACRKISEKKDYLEWYVVEQTVEYVLLPERIELIADGVIAEYNKEFSNIRIRDLEKKLAKVIRDNKKLFDMMLETNLKTVMRNCEIKLEELELQQIDLEIDIAKLKNAAGIRYKKKDIISWLNSFCTGDLFDMDFRKRIIDTFINSIYLYDDKIVIYYNLKGGKQISYIDMLENMDKLESEYDNDSPKTNKAPAAGLSSVRILDGKVGFTFQYTNPKYIFVDGLFGIVLDFASTASNYKKK